MGQVNKRNHNGDAIRLLLASAVVYVHVIQTSGHIPILIPNPVGFFIILSGFLVLGSFQRSVSYWEFAKKRLLRIGPAFVIAVALSFALHGLNFRLLLYYASSGLAGNDASTWNSPLYTLSIEEYFYIAMAILAAAGFYKRALWPMLGSLAVFALSAILEHPRGQSSPGLITGLAWMFLVGSTLKLMPSRFFQLWAALAALVAGIGILVFYPTMQSYFVWMSLLGYSMIYFSFYAKNVFGWMDKVGDMSYGV